MDFNVRLIMIGSFVTLLSFCLFSVIGWKCIKYIHVADMVQASVHKCAHASLADVYMYTCKLVNTRECTQVLRKKISYSVIIHCPSFFNL